MVDENRSGHSGPDQTPGYTQNSALGNGASNYSHKSISERERTPTTEHKREESNKML